MFNLKLTSAQQLILHTLESILVSALLAGVLAGYQYLGSDKISLSALAGVFIAGFLAAFFKGFLGLQNNANLPQAILDTVNEVKDAVASQPAQAPVVNIDTSALATQLKNELVKTANTSPVPQRPQISNLPTQPTLPAVNPPPNKAG